MRNTRIFKCITAIIHHGKVRNKRVNGDGIGAHMKKWGGGHLRFLDLTPFQACSYTPLQTDLE